MADEHPPEVMSALPHTRPHRRSHRRAPRPASSATASNQAAAPTDAAPVPRAHRLRQPAQPDGTPPGQRTAEAFPATRTVIVATAVQATAELAEIGLSASARALKHAVARLPRP